MQTSSFSDFPPASGLLKIKKMKTKKCIQNASCGSSLASSFGHFFLCQITVHSSLLKIKHLIGFKHNHYHYMHHCPNTDVTSFLNQSTDETVMLTASAHYLQLSYSISKIVC